MAPCGIVSCEVMGVTDAKRASNARHAAKLVAIPVKPQAAEAEAIKAAAKAAGESVQGYILQAVRDRIAAGRDERIRVSVPRKALEPYGKPEDVLREIVTQGLQRAKHDNV